MSYRRTSYVGGDFVCFAASLNTIFNQLLNSFALSPLRVVFRTAALQHRPVLFSLDLAPPHTPSHLCTARSLHPLATHPSSKSRALLLNVVVVVEAAVTSIDTPVSFSQDACCFHITSAIVNSSYLCFICARLRR